MVAATIEVRGARELRSAIRRAADIGLREELKTANRDAADVVAYEAQTIVPVKTGRLLESIRPTATVASGIVRAGRASVPWAGPIHFGWPAHGIAPNTFLYDAADNRVDEVVAKYQAALDRLAESITSAGVPAP